MAETQRASINFVASFPKSGNTWVRLFINALMENRADINRLSYVSADTNRYWYEDSSPTPIPNLGLNSQLILRNYILYKMAVLWNYKRGPFYLKTHWVCSPQFFPPGLVEKTIYLLRDPRDVVVSYARHDNCSIDQAIECLNNKNFVLLVDGLIQLVGDWSTHVKSWAGASLILKYEDMVSDPKKCFAEIAKQIDPQFDEGRLDGLLEMSSIEKARDQESIYGFSERMSSNLFFGKATPGIWKEVLSDSQVKAIVDVHGEVMEQHGYLESDAVTE